METSLFKASTGFPPELLELPVEAREEFFKEHFAGHDFLMRAFLALESSVFMPTIDGAVYRVFGPSGVGKSTACSLLRRRCDERMAPLLAQEPDRLACIYCRVPRYERGFDWCDLYARLLDAADEPFIDKKIPLPNRDGLNSRRKIPFAETRRMAGMRQSVESMLTRRRPAAVLLDEAQHIGYVSSGHALHGQHDILKSVAEETGIPFVLFGTYELIHFTGLSGQLARRGTRTHLPRYHGYDKNEAKIFQSVVLDFENHLPLLEKPDLISHWSFLYEGSLGLVGVLKVWLMRALHRTLNPQNKEDADCNGQIDYGLLQRTALDRAAREELLKEATEGEVRLAQEIDEEELRTALWNPPVIPPRVSNTSSKIRSASLAKLKGRKPGDRNPTRDPIGQEYAATSC